MISFGRAFDGVTRLHRRLVGSNWLALPRATRLTILGLLSWCMLAAVVTVAFAISIEAPASTIVVASATRADAIKRSVGSAAAVVQRPLFARSRQITADAPVLPQAPVMPVVVQDVGIALRGIYMDGKTAKAFVTTAQQPTGTWVAPDNVVDGWRLVAVRVQEVELEGQGRRVIVPYSTSAARK